MVCFFVIHQFLQEKIIKIYYYFLWTTGSHRTNLWLTIIAKFISLNQFDQKKLIQFCIEHKMVPCSLPPLPRALDFFAAIVSKSQWTKPEQSSYYKIIGFKFKIPIIMYYFFHSSKNIDIRISSTNTSIAAQSLLTMNKLGSLKNNFNVDWLDLLGPRIKFDATQHSWEWGETEGTVMERETRWNWLIILQMSQAGEIGFWFEGGWYWFIWYWSYSWYTKY